MRIILIDFIKKHRVAYIIGILFMLLTSYIQTLFPRVLGNVIDILSKGNFNNKDVYMNIIYILLIAVGAFITTYAWRNLVIGNARNLECTIREELFGHFQKLSPEFYNRRKTGDLIAYAINDINAVRMTFGPATAMAINGIVICVISIYSMANAIDWRLTLLSLIPIPFIVFFMLKIGGIVRKRFKKVQENFSSVSDRVQENITGIRVIKAYVQEDKEVKKFEKLNDQMVESNISMIRISAYLSPLIEICFTISFVLNLIIGGNMVLNGSISLGDFIAFNGYLAMILGPVVSIGRVITIFQRGMASLNRLNEIFNVKPDIQDGIAMIKDPINGPIEIKNLSFSYPGSTDTVLSDINLTIPKGYTIGIIGKTGSGKTTLVNLLLKMYNVESGKIFLGGTDINDYQLNALRDNFGLIPQDNFLFHSLITNNIKFFNDIFTDEDVIKATQDSCIYESIMGFPKGFDTILGERGVNLSGGQKQRISIARALIKNPEILILDDALCAVDTITEAQILENIKRVRDNKSSIIIAHRISAVKDANIIIVLD
ncbi:MAG TPA: ABC transporter ATP-binding protein, partial [Clostridia bacterium]|nr:ABC transporter ATP-binding protein [Clostridia bacterium]